MGKWPGVKTSKPKRRWLSRSWSQIQQKTSSKKSGAFLFSFHGHSTASCRESVHWMNILQCVFSLKVAMLELISKLNPDENNLVKFFEQFEYMGQTCLVFEMLDNDLYDLLEERQCNPVHLKEIRPIAQQVWDIVVVWNFPNFTAIVLTTATENDFCFMSSIQLLVALNALSTIGVLHTDIKPDNVMFVNSQIQPLRIKLIDFGLAISRSRVNPGMDLQPTGYRYLHHAQPTVYRLTFVFQKPPLFFHFGMLEFYHSFTKVNHLARKGGTCHKITTNMLEWWDKGLSYIETTSLIFGSRIFLSVLSCMAWKGPCSVLYITESWGHSYIPN